MTFRAWTPGTPGVPVEAAGIRHRAKEAREERQGKGEMWFRHMGKRGGAKQIGKEHDRSGKDGGISEVGAGSRTKRCRNIDRYENKGVTPAKKWEQGEDREVRWGKKDGSGGNTARLRLHHLGPAPNNPHPGVVPLRLQLCDLFLPLQQLLPT